MVREPELTENAGKRQDSLSICFLRVLWEHCPAKRRKNRTKDRIPGSWGGLILWLHSQKVQKICFWSFSSVIQHLTRLFQGDHRNEDDRSSKFCPMNIPIEPRPMANWNRLKS